MKARFTAQDDKGQTWGVDILLNTEEVAGSGNMEEVLDQFIQVFQDKMESQLGYVPEYIKAELVSE